MKTGRHIRLARNLALLAIAAPCVAACSSVSDFSLKDQEWFTRPGKMFNRSTTIETPPLSTAKAVSAEDLMSAEGMCAGMVAPAPSPADANASTEGGQSANPGLPAPTGAVALGHTECDVARAVGVAPDNINVTADARGDRVAQITYLRGPRPGAYTFTAGRLTSVERVDVPPPPKPTRPSRPQKRSAT